MNPLNDLESKQIRNIPGTYFDLICTLDSSNEVPMYSWKKIHTKEKEERLLNKTSLPEEYKQSIEGLSNLVEVVFPQHLPGETCWYPIKSPRLLLDVLAVNMNQIDTSRLITSMCIIGDWLTQLHSIELNNPKLLTLRTKHLVEGLPVWSKAITQAKENGIICPEDEKWEPTCLIHGSFGLATIVLGQRPGVFGWDYSGIGDSLFDLSCIISELWEIYSLVAEKQKEVICLAAKSFLTSYFSSQTLDIKTIRKCRQASLHKSYTHLIIGAFYAQDWNIARNYLNCLRSSEDKFFTVFEEVSSQLSAT